MLAKVRAFWKIYIDSLRERERERENERDTAKRVHLTNLT